MRKPVSMIFFVIPSCPFVVMHFASPFAVRQIFTNPYRSFANLYQPNRYRS